MKRYILPIITISFFLIYLLFPTANSSIDAWGFAAYVNQGENLFLSHHLFYNAFGFLWVRLFGLFFDMDSLRLLIALNSLIAAATLYLLGKTLRILGVEGKRMFFWVAFAGSSWAMSRFATENETYIISIFFSVLGSFFYLKGFREGVIKNFFFSGFFAALACLFHQVMFFWWLSLLIGLTYNGSLKRFIWFTLPAIIVPTSYILVSAFYYGQPVTQDILLQFVLRDYFSGAAEVTVGINNIFFTAINIVRTFIQVHGYFTILPRFGAIFIIGGVFAIGFFMAGLAGIKKTNWSIGRLLDLPVWVHILAIILHLSFAFLSNGNAEFMVMIPILFVLVFSQIVRNEIQLLGFVTIGMMVWNVSLGLIPLNQYPLDSNGWFTEMVIESQQQQKRQLYVLFNKPGVENRVRYNVGKDPKNIISGTQYDCAGGVTQRIHQALAQDSAVLTDCIIRPTTLSRETLVVSADDDNLFRGFYQKKVDSLQTLTGKYYLFEISRKQ